MSGTTAPVDSKSGSEGWPPSSQRRTTDPGGGTLLVAGLRDIRQDQRGLVGGKAVNLASMLKADLPVPPGFCVTVAPFRAFLDSCPQREVFEQVLLRLATALPSDFIEISGRLIAWLKDTPIPPQVEDAVLRHWRGQGEDQAYAVRSSATSEDSADHSFAGLFESVLNVQGKDALLAAIKTCWLSLFSTRALAYQLKNGLPVAKSGMAVVVQDMVRAETAGVLFTVDPTTGDDDRVVIEAARGLGDGVVGGRVAPDRVVLSKSTFAVIAHSQGRHAGDHEMVLGDGTAQELARLGQQVEELLRGPMDIEWALDGGTIYLLQARPVTGQHRAKTWGERQVWTNGNAGEAVPEPLTPLTYSMFMPFLQGLCDNLMGHLGLRIQAEDLVRLIAGRPYFNVNLGAALLRRAPGINPEDIGEIFGGAHETMIRNGLMHFAPQDLPRLRFYPWQVIRGLPPVLVAITRFMFLKDPPTVRSPLRPVRLSRVTSFENYSDKALLEAIRATMPTEQTGRDPALRLMGIGAFSLMVFFALSKRLFGVEGPALAGRLTAGLGTLDPAEAGRELWRLAKFAQEHAPIRRAVEEEHSFAALEQRLLALNEGKTFLERWHDLLARHGHHARGELELMNARWCETPDVVLALVRHYLEAITRNFTVPATRLAELRDQRAAMERECLRRLKNPCKRMLFRCSLDCARRGVAIKENVKSDFVHQICRARLLLLELGRRLVERGGGVDPNDVFFLRVEELRLELLTDAGTGLGELTAARRAEYDRNQRLHPPPVVFGSGDPNAWQAEVGVPAAELLEGLAVSPGVAIGQAKVILKPTSDDRVLPGEILIAPSTDPAWSPYFLTAAGIAIDLGGVLSHGSILAREYGLPAVTNLGSATRTVRTGDLVQVDGTSGRVIILERASNR